MVFDLRYKKTQLNAEIVNAACEGAKCLGEIVGVDYNFRPRPSDTEFAFVGDDLFLFCVISSTRDADVGYVAVRTANPMKFLLPSKEDEDFFEVASRLGLETEAEYAMFAVLLRGKIGPRMKHLRGKYAPQRITSPNERKIIGLEANDIETLLNEPNATLWWDPYGHTLFQLKRDVKKGLVKYKQVPRQFKRTSRN